jgi:hypothetical protein
MGVGTCTAEGMEVRTSTRGELCGTLPTSPDAGFNRGVKAPRMWSNVPGPIGPGAHGEPPTAFR